MPNGTCDPASRGMTYNEGMLAVDNGAVTVTYRYGWDGVSTLDSATGCVGPILYISGTNNSQFTYYAHFAGRKGTWRTVQINPGQTLTFDKTGQLKQAGFNDSTDVEGLVINQSSTPPSSERQR